MKNSILIFVFLFAFSFVAAHPGRTNAKGCHTNKKTGVYHCHNSKVSTPVKKQAKPKNKQNDKKQENKKEQNKKK